MNKILRIIIPVLLSSVLLMATSCVDDSEEYDIPHIYKTECRVYADDPDATIYYRPFSIASYALETPYTFVKEYDSSNFYTTYTFSCANSNALIHAEIWVDGLLVLEKEANSELTIRYDQGGHY